MCFVVLFFVCRILLYLDAQCRVVWCCIVVCRVMFGCVLSTVLRFVVFLFQFRNAVLCYVFYVVLCDDVLSCVCFVGIYVVRFFVTSYCLSVC